MAISKELFLAILSMDSYNRGYGAGIAGLSESSNGSAKIGNATISKTLANFDMEGDAKSAGFYAISYTVGTGVDDVASGTKIISYRGTDNFSDDPEKGGNDILEGWVAGTGTPTSQTTLAMEFYSAVTGKSVFEGAQNDTLLTGHSLGGGLPL